MTSPRSAYTPQFYRDGEPRGYERRDAICGGVVSQSKFFSDPGLYMLCFILPDPQYEKWLKLKELGKEKEAKRLFKKYSGSAI